jgi:hypothetical protein
VIARAHVNCGGVVMAILESCIEHEVATTPHGEGLLMQLVPHQCKNKF